jgi:hypothetical protein
MFKLMAWTVEKWPMCLKRLLQIKLCAMSLDFEAPRSRCMCSLMDDCISKGAEFFLLVAIMSGSCKVMSFDGYSLACVR